MKLAIALAFLGLLAAGAASAQPKPEFFGVFAVVDGKLVELPQNEGNCLMPPCRRGPTTRTALPHGGVSFIVYKRQPERVKDEPWIHIIGHVRRFVGSSGMEAVDYYSVTDHGFPFRVGPVPGLPEALWIRHPDSSFRLPPGRFSLIYGGPGSPEYDFAVPGPVPEEHQCWVAISQGWSSDYKRCSEVPGAVAAAPGPQPLSPGPAAPPQASAPPPPAPAPPPGQSSQPATGTWSFQPVLTPDSDPPNCVGTIVVKITLDASGLTGTTSTGNTFKATINEDGSFRTSYVTRQGSLTLTVEGNVKQSPRTIFFARTNVRCRWTAQF